MRRRKRKKVPVSERHRCVAHRRPMKCGRGDVASLLHACTEIERWRREYNEERPKKALGGLTPAAYAKQLKSNSGL